MDIKKPELKFEEARKEDIKDMLDLYNYYIKNSTATFDLEEISTETFSKRIKIGDTKYKTYVVRKNDTMIGFCFYIPYRENFAYEKTVEMGIYIKPEFTGKSYGETIAMHLMTIIRDNNFINIIASISSDNTYSIRLFKKLGFRQCADYKEVAFKHGHYVGIVDFQFKLSDGESLSEVQ